MQSNLIVRDILFRTSERIPVLSPLAWIANPVSKKLYDATGQPHKEPKLASINTAQCISEAGASDEFEVRFLCRARFGVGVGVGNGEGVGDDGGAENVVMASATGDILVVSTSGIATKQFVCTYDDDLPFVMPICALDAARVGGHGCNDCLFVLSLDGVIRVLSCEGLIPPTNRNAAGDRGLVITKSLLNTSSAINLEGSKLTLPENATCMRAFTLTDLSQSQTDFDTLLAIGDREGVHVYSFRYSADTGGSLTHIFSSSSSASLGSTVHQPAVAVHSLDFCHAGFSKSCIIKEGAGAAGNTAECSEVKTSAYIIIGLETGTIEVYRYECVQNYWKSENGHIILGMSKPIVKIENIAAIVGGSPPLPVGRYLGPAYVRALPRTCMNNVSVTTTEVDKPATTEECEDGLIGQFLVAWLDGRLAHCHVATSLHFPQSSQILENNNASKHDSFSSTTHFWNTVRCLHTPDSLYRLDFFSESLKPPDSHSFPSQVVDNEAARSSGISDAFAGIDGKRYISCAAASWSGHTYIVHVLIHDNLSEYIIQRSGEVLPLPSSPSSTSDNCGSGSESESVLYHDRKDEVIYCFDSRLLLAGGASRTFCCATYNTTPSLIFVSADNSIRAAPNLKNQLTKFKEPRLQLLKVQK